MKKTRTIETSKSKRMQNLIAVLALALCILFVATGCGNTSGRGVPGINESASAETGTLYIRVNPEIAVLYDEAGIVTELKACNEDAKRIIAACSDLVGMTAEDAVRMLVDAIGEAGYFAEEAEGTARRIVLEIEAGSVLPDEAFLDRVVAQIRDCTEGKSWSAPLVVEGESDFGMTDYDDTDYGPHSDGVTDYGMTDYDDTDYGMTDYDDTDYGPHSDGVTDFGTTDYGTTDYGMTDYDDTDYGPHSDGVTDFGTTDYGTTDYGMTDYDDTDYGPHSDGVTDFGTTDYGTTDYGMTDYGKTDYDDTDYGLRNENRGV